MNNKQWVCLSLVLVLLLACSLPTPPPPTATPLPEISANVITTTISFPSVANGGVVWLPNGTIFIASHLTNNEQFFITEDVNNPSWQEITFPIDPLCSSGQRFRLFNGLPDGRLGALKNCYAKDEEKPYITIRYPEQLVAYDLETEVMEPIISSPYQDQYYIALGQFSWNPEFTAGVYGAGDLLGTLYWMSRDDVTPMDIDIVDGDRTWSLADSHWATVHRTEDTNFGIARRPGWSPDGSSIAFFANSARGSGVARHHAEYKLYLMDAVTLEPKAVLGGIYYAHRLAWSPDSQWIAFLATMENRRGLWIYNPSTDELVTIAKDNIIDFAWSPDGQKILGVRDESVVSVSNAVLPTPTPIVADCSVICNTELVLYDITALLK